jgi:carbon monoxide dehydrogenase subunit G
LKITGKSTIDAPRDQVWAALNDIDVLARIVPGCERLEQIGENEFEGTVKIGIQAIKGTYSGKIRLEDIQPPYHYKLVASGRSASGVVDGAGAVDLEEQDGQTILTYSGDAQIGGTLASVGQRLIEGASKQMINQSIKALVEQISLRARGPAASEPASEPVSGASPSASGPTSESAPTTTAAEAEQALPQTTSKAPAATTALPSASAASTGQTEQSSFERRTVLVPAGEQLRPELVIRGVVEDIIKERPWLPWVVIAFLLGVLIGRSRR